jgi:hypothetical protein
MGMFVLITNTDLSGEQALQLYREKDGVPRPEKFPRLV